MSILGLCNLFESLRHDIKLIMNSIRTLIVFVIYLERGNKMLLLKMADRYFD